MAWTTVHLRVTTPLFNGGAEADASPASRDDETGIRVASIRGAMRFWFRAMAGAFTGPDLAALAAMERRVFGGIAGAASAVNAQGDEPHATPSPLLLRIPGSPDALPPSARRDWLRPGDDRKWIIYLLGQGLGDLVHGTLKRPSVEPGTEFELKVGFRHPAGEDSQIADAVETLAFASLWLTCTYGGIGARTRRGFGGLRVAGVDGPRPSPWQGDALLTPGIDHYEHLRHIWLNGPLVPCMNSFAVLAGRRDLDARAWGDITPTFPVLSPKYTGAALSEKKFGRWDQALSYAGEEFRNFRANANYESARYRPKRKTAEWNEVVGGSKQHFPLGVLGLPVNYQRGVSVNVIGAGDVPLRRSSSLWLRVAGHGQTKRLLSFAFHTEFLPGSPPPHVRVLDRGQPRPTKPNLDVDTGDIRDVTGQWMRTISAGGTFTEDHRRTLPRAPES